MSLSILRMTGYRIEGTVYNNDRDKVVFNNPVFYIDSIHREKNTTITNPGPTVIFNELDKVILQVDKSGHSSSDKEEIKNILREFTRDIHTKTLDIIIANLKEKFKQYFDVASPYLQMLFSHFLRM
jgi:hypothetical protein